MDIDTVRLRAFMQVVERGTVAAAALALDYTAAGVSQQITKLEKQLGTPLFDRAGGRLQLKAAGESLVPLARNMIELVDRTAAVRRTEIGPRPVTIATFASALDAIIVPLLHKRELKGWDVELRDEDDDEALRSLRLGEVDVAIVQEYTGDPIPRTKELNYRRIATDPLRLIVPPRFAVSVKLVDLSGIGWLVNGTGTKCEAASERTLRRAGVVPRIVGRVTDNDALVSLVSVGHGATVTPELVLRGRKRRVTVADLDLGVTRTILAVTRPGFTKSLSPLLAALGQRNGTTQG